MKLRIGIPKGSLQNSTVELFRRAGFNINVNERNYYPSIDDAEIECVLIRAQEIAPYGQKGAIDCGITGKDWIEETGSKVVEVSELVYAKQGLGKAKWVVAVPEASSINSIKELEGKRIATELVSLTRKFFEKNKVKVDVEFSWGATEIKVPMLADAIVEITETGASLKANKLKVIDTVMETTTRLIANPEAFKDSWKKQKISEIALLLESALEAQKRVGVMMNVPDSKKEKVLEILKDKNPTISTLKQGGIDVFVVLEKDKEKSLIPKLIEAGAEGVVEFEISKYIKGEK